jgi:hypothetical protein
MEKGIVELAVRLKRPVGVTELLNSHPAWLANLTPVRE